MLARGRESAVGLALSSPVAMSGALPTFVIIGAQKCGTTALHSYLARHPEISMSRPKELDFFVAEKNWDRGLDWYRQRWNGPDKPIRGESSPNYTAYPNFDGVPERMVELLPDIKLIFMVRDPVDRVRSSYIHAVLERGRAPADAGGRARSGARLRAPLALPRAAHPVPRPLPDGADPAARAGRAAERPEGDAGARVRVPRGPRGRLAGVVQRTPARDLGAAAGALGSGVFAANRLSVRWWRKIRDRRPFSKPFVQAPLEDDLRAELEDMLRDDVAAFRELTGRTFRELVRLAPLDQAHLDALRGLALAPRPQALGERPPAQCSPRARPGRRHAGESAGGRCARGPGRSPPPAGRARSPAVRRPHAGGSRPRPR